LKEATVAADPSANKHPRRAQLIPLIVLVLVICVPVVVGWLNHEPDPPSPCRLLSTGWTMKEITHGHIWRDWPATQSITDRELEVTQAAATECPHLVGL
jgi:hypothetical protein